MKPISILFAAVAVILSSASLALADDCGYINEKKVCWEGGTSTTLNWAYSRTTVGGYQIEARDFNWLGSVFVRVTYNNIVKEGMLSEGEGFIFDFTNGSTFEGVKIIADQVSNINPLPANIGVYPNDPNARITVKLPAAEKKKIPALGVSITMDGEEKAGSTITASIKIENTGEADIIDTDLSIFYDSLKLLNEYDMRDGFLSQGTTDVPDIRWENVSKYRLTPAYPAIVRDGFFIKVINFSRRKALLSAVYNLSAKNGSLIEGDSVILNFTRDEDYLGLRLLGGNISESSAELTLQSPQKNILRRNYPVIFYGNSVSTRVSFVIPASSRKSFTIIVNASGKDREGNSYVDRRQVTITSSNTLSIRKWASNSILGERIYPEYYYGVGGIRTKKDVTYINIRVDNLQSYPVRGARLVETVPPSFDFADDANATSISWDFDLNASDYREFKYSLKPKRPGLYNLPKAELTWTEWGEVSHKESESPRTTVSGPYMGFDRSFNKSNVNIGDTLQVALSVINNGDVPTNISVRETIPRNATFLSGSLSFSGFLNPGEKADIIYNISASQVGTLEFRAPEISSGNKGFDWYASMPVKDIQVLTAEKGAPERAPDTAMTSSGPPGRQQKGLFEMIDEKIPWFEGAVSMITFLFAIFILLALNRNNRML